MYDKLLNADKKQKSPSLERGVDKQTNKMVQKEVEDVRTNVRPSERSTVRSVDRLYKRIRKRHAFELFQDQIESLKKLARSDEDRGGQGSMSQFVREAIDSYLAKKNRTDE